ncbi:MAG: hypothetical protein SFU84_00160 [Gemmatimonadales bacterium]|nr:hypothetical protein [Gemmatimonadales bacterium]
MAFGFPAYHTERYSAGPGNSPDVRAAVRATLSALSWWIREERSEHITASTGLNMRSWGEKILISFLPDGSISVTSKCAWPTQCLDWGKNKANVGKFVAEIRNHVSQPVAAVGA